MRSEGSLSPSGSWGEGCRTQGIDKWIDVGRISRPAGYRAERSSWEEGLGDGVSTALGHGVEELIWGKV